MTEAPDPRFPIGKFKMPATITREDCRYATQTLADAPEQLREAVRGLGFDQMNTPYREGGWTLRQVVHHLADSHMTAFFRVRLALTEEWPVVPGYPEKAFAVLPDVHAPSELDDAQWKRGFEHAERGRQTIEQATLLYAWHSSHHIAHITQLRAQQGW